MNTNDYLIQDFALGFYFDNMDGNIPWELHSYLYQLGNGKTGFIAHCFASSQVSKNL